MATYTITLNERTASGKALVSYLQALGVLIQKVAPATKSSYERSQEDIRMGRGRGVLLGRRNVQVLRHLSAENHGKEK